MIINIKHLNLDHEKKNLLRNSSVQSLARNTSEDLIISPPGEFNPSEETGLKTNPIRFFHHFTFYLLIKTPTRCNARMTDTKIKTKRGREGEEVKIK